MTTSNNGDGHPERNERFPPGMRPPSNPGPAFDPGLISRLANELFSTLPDEISPMAGGAVRLAHDVPKAEQASTSHLPMSMDPPTAFRSPFGMASSSLVPAEAAALALGCQIPAKFFAQIPVILPQMTSGASSGLASTVPPHDPTPSYYFLPTSVPVGIATSNTPFDANRVRADFPALHQKVNGKPLVWLDNAATTHKPRAVIDALVQFYERDNSNVHRAAHTLAARATTAYEGAREKVARFLNAGSTSEIVFVRGTTEAINLVAQTFGRQSIGEGDEIVLTTLEHHANIVPWQMLAREKGARLRVVPVNDRGELILEDYERLLNPRTRLVAVTQVSNALGTVNPVETMTSMAHRHGARVLVDGAQSVQHMRADVQQIGCDFFVFSGHKVFGPTGVGALFGKKELLDQMPPWQGGGNMIRDVTFERTSYVEAPGKFEAGTAILAGAVGLGVAIDYLERVGLPAVARHEAELLEYMRNRLAAIPGLRIIGNAAERVSVVSFVLEGSRTEDVGRYLDSQGIAVRSGHHCAQPTLRRFGVEQTVRPSIALYNTREDIDRLADAVRHSRSSPR